MSKTYSRSDAIVRAQEAREEREAERFLQFIQSHVDDVPCVSEHPEQCRCGDCLTYLAGQPKPEWYETEEFREGLSKILNEPGCAYLDKTDAVIDHIAFFRPRR